MALRTQDNIVVLVGGVGGAKLALGLQQIIAPDKLSIIVNTGDDFWHYGLRICPDVDTVLYTLSGRVDPQNGWGVSGDTTTTLESLRGLGEEPWFRLGDKDIATHLLRTSMLRDGHSLTQIVAHLAKVMGIEATVLPMTDTYVPTMINTAEHGELEFQEYFVRHRWQPRIVGLRNANMEAATLSANVREALHNADVILVGPSNPWLSIAPILAVPGMRDLLTVRDVPRVAVTPIIAGKAVKGPAAKLMSELGYEVSAKAVAEHYGDLLNGFVYDRRDAVAMPHGLRSVALDTMMVTDTDKARLARDVIDWIMTWEGT